MITPLLRTVLEPVIARHRDLRLWRWTAIGLAALTLGATLLVGLHQSVPAPKMFGLLLVLITIWIASRANRHWQPDFTEIARRIEERHPELHALLLTAIEQKPEPKSGRMTFLQQRVVQEAVRESRKSNWLDAIPSSRLWTMRGLTLALALVFLSLAWQTPVLKRETSAAAAAAKEPGVKVTPGDATLERGSGLVVLADFQRDVPSEATLVIQPKNQPAQRVPLVKNLDDPVFGGGLPEVDADLTYRIEYAGRATRDFTVKVFEHPRLDRADAALHFPAYTKLPEKQVPDTRRVSAVEGTKLDVAFQLNKPVKSAKLVAKDGTAVPLAVPADKPVAELRDFPLKASQTYELKLEDADGRANKVPAQFIVEALPNRRPELKFQTPKGDQRVSPLEEVAFRAEAWDDFGLARYGLTINVAGRGEQHIELGKETGADEKRALAHLLKLEELGVKPDELVSWFLWAEDTGPDGQARRTATDMFFAEVRPFEEIYRRDDGGGGGGGGGGGEEASKLAELQKQIITATWNLKRAEDANPSAQKPTPKYLEDEPVIRDSQAEALEQAKKLAAKLEEPKLQALAENVTGEMQKSLDHLTKAATTPAPLTDALAAEQAAYNALLKLAAHEFRISRNKGKGKGGGKQQQQLDALEMKDEKERYETKNEAESPQEDQQREQLAILNRLKELAQRQQDINERLKELQTALQAAKTEPEKEEIRRQLKRLREEEQQLLADLDETRQRMEQSSNQAQFAEDRRQLEQTRNEAQKTAEAMEKGEASQALASGTRTQRELQQMRDEFRKRTSGQFNDQMRQMRTDARELAQNQQEIAEQLKSEPRKQERPTLDGSSEREQLAEKFTKQQGDLTKLTDKMKGVSEQAEAAEPLLAKELYDTLRKTTQAGTSETLEKSQILVQRGYTPQAQKFEEKARQEIEELKTGVERAAESVLGDEAEALRQARTELDALKEQIEREIGRARPDLAEAKSPAGGQEREGQPPGQQGKEGQQPGQQPGFEKSDAPDGQQPGDQAGKQPGERGQDGERGDKGQGKAPGEQPQGQGQSPSPDGQPGQQAGEKEGQGKDGQQPGKEGQQGQGQMAQQGATPGKGEGEGKGEGQGQGEGKPGQTAQANQGQERTPGQGQGEGQSQAPGQGRGQGQGQTASGRGEGVQEPNNSQAGDPNGQRGGARLSQLAGGPRQRGGIRGGANEGGGGPWGGGVEGEQAGPLTGEKFTEWSDRLRNVEEMIDDPNLRTEVARIREFAKGVRVEFKRHSVAPNWDMVKTKIGTPLAELRDRLTEELARRESKENLVPIDRDPVPTKYAERVRRYYEELGRSR